MEDEPSAITWYREHFEEFGYTFTVCRNGKEALDVFKENPSYYDVVFTDQAMFNMTGKQLSQELLKIKPDVPIILATGYSTVITEKEAKELGIRHYIEKPIDLGRLDEIIQQCLQPNQDGA